MPETIVLASGNPGKLREMQAMLSLMDIEIQPQSRWDVPEAVEDGAGFIENALIKARHAAGHTGLPAIADDSGLVVPALDGEPGVQSARYAGEHGNDQANNLKLLEVMQDLQGAERAAFFQCVMVYARHEADPVPLIASGQWWGEIAPEPLGEGGFGYDPLFWLPGLSKTSAQLQAGEKNQVSHRGKAMRRLLAQLKLLDDG
ncbi:MAG: RdgB/HAM1 family non-canonical purine NTP pyrophosphatase [Xanthomonadales bacterium]|nr:RdgB/HAM1 family non-canonical purine NTP pyrophosphatase [Xanthomonadales bacterium]NNL94709.1 RdgB/HAM1 family non-canonical purine NTP pyrophosphatase [Xanthomonadales bacterium]